MKPKIITALLLFASFSSAGIISGEVEWFGQYYPKSQLGDPPFPETGNATFSFDTNTETGVLNCFYSNNMNEPLDGNYEFKE